MPVHVRGAGVMKSVVLILFPAFGRFDIHLRVIATSYTSQGGRSPSAMSQANRETIFFAVVPQEYLCATSALPRSPISRRSLSVRLVAIESVAARLSAPGA